MTTPASDVSGVRPLLLVDLDGVINVVGRGAGSRELEADFKREGHRMRVPVGMAGRFARLEEVFECVWATTWGEDAPILGRFFKFGATWPSIFIGAGSQPARTGKLPDVRGWCEANAVGRPVAWVDDDLWPDAYDWSVARGRTLILRTLPEEGLTDAQTDQLLAWAAARGTSLDDTTSTVLGE